MIGLFPGRTLEELDQMDLNRYYRAILAARLQAVEGRRKLFLQGKITGKEIDAEDWQMILQMDEWIDD